MNKIDLILQGNFDNYTYEIAKHYLNLDFVNKIVISCWKNNHVPLISEKQIVIIQSEDVEKPGITNRNRQIKSTQEGLKAVETDFSVKLRSDQKISLDSMRLMYNFYQQHSEQLACFADGNKPKNKICVAGIFRPFPFHPRDHIFWGNTYDLIDVFNIPLDEIDFDIKIPMDYNKYLRSEAYICMWYYSKFDNEILKYIANSNKYLVDSASHINEAIVKSEYWGAKIFQPFPKIDFEWPKHGLKKYHYDFTAKHFGEYWAD